MNNNNKIFQQTYLEIISEEYHRKPILGWNKDSFEKILTKMLVKGMNKGLLKGKLAKQFDDFFVDKSVFSFKDVFKWKPLVSSSGSGKNLNVILQYDYQNDDLKNLLVGKGPASEKQEKSTFQKLLGKLKKTNQQGIIYNRAFFKQFRSMISDETGEQQEEQLDEQYSNLSKHLNIINQDASQNAIIQKLSEKIHDSKCSLTVYLNFNTIKYVDKIKKKQKQYLNPNRVEACTGQILLKFKIGESEFKFNVTGQKDGLQWDQYRTANMDPPTPIGDQLKRIWNNPSQGTGLVGLAAKKVGAGLKNTLFGSMASKTVQEQSISISFLQEYSKNNMINIAPSMNASKKNNVNDEIISELQSSSKLISNVNYDSKEKTYNLIVSFKNKQIGKISIKMK